MKIPSGKTKVEIMQDVHQSDFKKGDIGYIDGYVQAGDTRPYASVVRISDGYIDLATVWQLKAIVPERIKTKKAVKEKEFDFKAKMLELGVKEQTLSDWLEVRSKKKATNSETAYNSIVAEIKKAGIHPQEAIGIAAASSWKGFKAEWINQSHTTINFDSKGWSE